ncbi:MAG: molybdopterin-synthase adenylyltransferase MoeB [Betaproteobacteria bacterium]|nr:molybdopterin-synthase adenylyltransferase MoeB [Betaproteobacteria bacterium]
MNDRQLLRYGRHLLLNEFGIEGQEKLLASRVLVVGAGGLGSAALLFLASAGIGELVIADGDTVELSNLQRQVIHRESSLGRNKAASAAEAVLALNADCKVSTLQSRLTGSNLSDAVAQVNLVLDCSDNFATRHALNRASVSARVPLVSGAAIRFDGQVTSFDPRRASSSCYHCLFPDASELEEERCAVMGVFAPIVGVIGAMQASEALRILAGIGDPLVGRLLIYEGLSQRWQEVRLAKDPACPVCSVVRNFHRSAQHAPA